VTKLKNSKIKISVNTINKIPQIMYLKRRNLFISELGVLYSDTHNSVKKYKFPTHVKYNIKKQYGCFDKRSAMTCKQINKNDNNSI
jgi:hypothetical protein